MAKDYYQPFVEDNIYHVFSRAVGSEKLFIEPENYRFFLQRYDKYICPVVDTFCYNLLPNHFHFIIQVKPYDQLLELYRQKKINACEYEGWQHKFVMQHFSNLLNSYTKSFNKLYNRKGALFMDYIRRVEIKTDAQLTSTIFYVNKNAVHHGYCSKIPDWPWSSYQAIISSTFTKLERKKVIEWFGSIEKFIEYHSQEIFLKEVIEVE
jgi:putative transposase